MVVVTEREDGPYADLAAELAGPEEACVTYAEPLPEGPVRYVCPPDELRESRLLALQRRLDRLGPSRGGFGVFTGRSPSATRQLAERSPVTETGPHLVVLRREDRSIRSPDDDTTVLTRGEATVDNFRAALSTDPESISFMIDGRSIHTHLDDGYICGVPTTETLSTDGYQPRCLDSYDGGDTCPRGGGVVHADRVGVAHLFLNSCTSLVPANSTAGLPVHVGMGLLSGATSVLAGYRPRKGSPEEVTLHRALLREGYTAAERAHLLNRVARSTGTETHAYAVFGDPTAGLASEPSPAPRVDWSADGHEVTLSAVDTHLIDLDVGHLSETDLRVRVTSETHADWPLLYAVVEDGRTARLLVYSWGRIEADGLRLRVEPADAGLRPIARAVGNFDELDQLGIVDGKARSQRQNLRQQLWSMTGTVTDSQMRVQAAGELRDRVDRLAEQLTALEDRILDRLAARGPGFLFDDYEERVRTEAFAVAERPCENCGRPVFRRRVTDLEGRVDRTLGFCPRCVNVFDVPTGLLTDRPRLDGSFDARDGRETTTVSLTVQNPAATPARVVWFPWLWSGDADHRGREVFSPRVVRDHVAPGETACEEFTVDLGGLPSETYSVYGYALIDCELALVARRLVV